MDDAQGSSGSSAPTYKNLGEALLGLQKDMPAVDRDGYNPHFKNSFTTLGNLLSTVKPVLHRHGFVLAQLPKLDSEGRPVLHTRLIHPALGEELEFESALSASKNDPAGQGAAITYMKRYALAAALAIADQDDQDAGGDAPDAAPELDPERVEKIIAGFGELRLNYSDIGVLLGSCGIDGLRAKSQQAIQERISGLTSDQATQLEAAMDDRSEKGGQELAEALAGAGEGGGD